MMIQAKVVEGLRGFHIPHKCFFQSHFVLSCGKERRVVSVEAFEGFPRVRPFLLMFTLALAVSSWKGTVLAPGQGFSLSTHRGTSDGHSEPPPLTFSPRQAVWKEGPLHPGECACMFPAVFEEVRDNYEEMIQRELVGISASFLCRATGSRDWQMAGLQVMCFY